jgi:hypothetical protein
MSVGAMVQKDFHFFSGKKRGEKKFGNAVFYAAADCVHGAAGACLHPAASGDCVRYVTAESHRETRNLHLAINLSDLNCALTPSDLNCTVSAGARQPMRHEVPSAWYI